MKVLREEIIPWLKIEDMQIKYGIKKKELQLAITESNKAIIADEFVDQLIEKYILTSDMQDRQDFTTH